MRSYPSISNTLDKEVLRQRSDAELVLDKLNESRREIAFLERGSAAARDAANRFDRVERFLGRLEQALQLYDRADISSGLNDEIASLRTDIARLQALVSESEIQRKQQNALRSVASTANRIIPDLDAEWPDAPIRLVVEDLTAKVTRGTRDDYLWEIGSGANWIAYHIAILVALQKFFLTTPHHPVPGLLVFDQPSQVYFPKRAAGSEPISADSWRDEDVIAVRKIFSVLGRETLAERGRLQVIVLDHAHEDVWGGLPGVELKADWRGEALVPESWVRQQQ